MLKTAFYSNPALPAERTCFRFLTGALLSGLILMLGGLDLYAQDAPPVTTEAAPAAVTEPESTAPTPEGAAEAAPAAEAEPAAAPAIDSGANAWIMTATALVLFMTLPGLALFYGGLVRQKNVLSVLAQCLACAGLVTVLWWAVGYSSVFGGSPGSPIWGGTNFYFFKGVTGDVGDGLVISHNMFAMFQLMFAIITPALIVGAIAERMKFTAIMLFVLIWMLAVYFPLAHMVWGATGFMNGPFSSQAGIFAVDFAGGTVVHMSSGWSALVLCLMVGPRRGFGKQPMPPHSMVLCMTGTGILWFGWYGFNAGSALAADSIAAQAFTTTTICAATACLTWGIIEKITRKHASVLGFCSGVVAGLVVITPAAGFVSATSAVIMGVLASVACYLGITVVKRAFKYDDSLDTFGIHGIGGTLGALLTGVFADPTINSALTKESMIGKILWLEQLKAIGVTIIWVVPATLIIGWIVKFSLGGLRPSAEEEETGLDITDHGEEGYTLE